MKRFIVSFAALATLFACAEKKGMEPTSGDRLVSIVASTVDTKTTLDSENSVVWSSGDVVAVWFSGESVPNHLANFTTSNPGSIDATFTSTLPNSVTVAGGYNDKAYAVYPAEKMANNGTVTFDLPAEQQAGPEGSFAPGLNLSSAVVSLADLDRGGKTSATFKNAFSIIRFTLGADPDDLQINKVVITTEGDPLVGNAPMTFVAEGDDAGRLVVGTPDSESQSVTFTPADGQTAFDAGTKYNVLVYPGEYTNLNVTLTDTDDVEYVRTLEGTFNFSASKFYNFTFNTKYVKTYTFTATGRNFDESDMIATVFLDGSNFIYTEVLTAAADLTFTGELTKEVVNGQNVTGFAVYPSTSYIDGVISYTLPADGTGAVADLYSAAIPADLYTSDATPESTEVEFTSVENSLAKLQFTVPAGIASLDIVSNKGIVGSATMTVDADGKLVAGTGDENEIHIDSAEAREYTLYVYPFADATLTVTLKNAAGASYTMDDLTGKGVAAGGTLTIDLSGAKFDKDGDFTNEKFTEGEGNYDFN